MDPFKTVPFSLIVEELPPQEDYFPGIAPASQAVPQGTPALYTVSLSVVGGFAGQVALSVTDLPQNATATFDKSVIGASDVAILTVETAGVVAGSYDMALVATVV